MTTLKQVLHVYQSASTHWVGDGFHVRNLFPSNDLGQRISPFLLLDYAGPTEFSPTERPRGVGEHPHRPSGPSPYSPTLNFARSFSSISEVILAKS
jgi:redox-sensitive bicupin YhaK (pirin superfamily)